MMTLDNILLLKAGLYTENLHRGCPLKIYI
jgi:hypothetical protein